MPAQKTATEEDKLAESVAKVSINEPRLAFNQKEPKVEKKPYKGAVQPQTVNGLPPPPVLSPALQTALFTSKDRMFVLSLEQDLINFIASNTDSYLLSPMNSYYRMLTHHTAAYYSLGHTLNNEGNSILVFKHIGIPLIQPYPLSLIPFDTSLQPLNPGAPIPSHFAHGQRKGSYEQAHHIHMPPPPPPPQHPQPFAYIPASLPPQPMLAQPQPPTIKRTSVPSEKKSGTVTPKEFKLMKRKTDDKESGEEKEEKEGAETKEENKVVTPVVDPQELESERASRESLYQKARERIFQNEEDEDDDGEEEQEEEEEESTDYISRDQSSPDIPRIISQPQLPHHPQPYAYPPQPQMYPPFMSQHIQQPLIPQYYYQPQPHPQQFYHPRPQFQKRYNHKNFNTSYKQQGQPRNHNNNSYNNNNKYTNYNPSYNQKQQLHQQPREQREQPQEQPQQDEQSQESSTPPKSNESRTTV